MVTAILVAVVTSFVFTGIAGIPRLVCSPPLGSARCSRWKEAGTCPHLCSKRACVSWCVWLPSPHVQNTWVPHTKCLSPPVKHYVLYCPCVGGVTLLIPWILVSCAPWTWLWEHVQSLVRKKPHNPDTLSDTPAWSRLKLFKRLVLNISRINELPS